MLITLVATRCGESNTTTPALEPGEIGVLRGCHPRKDFPFGPDPQTSLGKEELPHGVFEKDRGECLWCTSIVMKKRQKIEFAAR